VETYWQPEHPIQVAALETVAALSDVPVERIARATDGCGVVTFGLPLRGLALAFARLADPSGVADGALRSALERIRDAMMAHPELVAGERRMLDTALMRAAPGRLVSKGGAEGVQAVGILEGGQERVRGAAGLALKIEDGDGARRARSTATVAALRQLGALDEEVLVGRLGDFASPPIRDPRGEPSGEVRAAFALT
jgi:L-asparaginase II